MSLDSKSASRFSTGTEALDVLARFVTAIERTPLVAIQSFNRDGTVCLWNATSASIYGIPAQQALGKRIDTLISHGENEAEFADNVARIWATGQPVLPRDWQVTSTVGKELWVYSTMFPVYSKGRPHQIFSMDIDISLRKREELALLAVGANFRTLFDRSPDALLLIENLHFIDVNPAALSLFGFASKDDMIGRSQQDISPLLQPDGSQSDVKARQMLEQVRQTGSLRYDWLHQDRLGNPFWAEVLCTEVPIDDRAVTYAVIRDIRQRKHAEQAMLLASKVFENSSEGILIANNDQVIVSANHAVLTLTGYAPEEMTGKALQILCADLDQESLFEAIFKQVGDHGCWKGEMWSRHRNGEGLPLWLSLTSVMGEQGKITHYIAILTDISERKACEEHIRHQAEHDFLTNLPNRILLLDRLQQAITAAQRHRTQLAILFLDLDHFKTINDSFGHQIGDKLLQQVAVRLKKCVRTVDTVCRLGGDEFVIMLVDIASGPPLAHIADNVLAAIHSPYAIERFAFSISTCIGISIFPDDGTDMEILIKNADLAMYHAKAIGPNRYQFFDADMNTRIVDRMQLENDLRVALEKEQFLLYYQPEQRLSDGRTTTAEALIRWQHPVLGLLPPERFIAVAEECGLMIPLGEWVLQTACRQAKAWQREGRPVRIGVNLSSAQFQQKNLLPTIVEALHRADLAPHHIELEITERILMEQASDVIPILHALHDLGLKIAIDNFGTGFSSVSYLKRIPFDKLKIDQSIVRDIGHDPQDASIINAIIVMAKSLDLCVVAEGVETQPQFAFLAAHGCDEYQGYFFSRELSPAEFSSLSLASSASQ